MTIKLKMQFNVTPAEGSTTTKRTWTFNYISNDLQTVRVTTLANTIVSNGAIFASVPTSIIKAETEQTTTTQILPAE